MFMFFSDIVYCIYIWIYSLVIVNKWVIKIKLWNYDCNWVVESKIEKLSLMLIKIF